MVCSSLCLLLTALVISSRPTWVDAGHEWTYEGEHGPDHWSQLGFRNCEKHRQSPIAIETSSAIHTHMKPMEFYHFDEIPSQMNLTNNFHSAGAVMTTKKVPWIRSGGLPGEYEVIGFHFHWGEDDTKGSEHTINGRSYPLEMHVVCRNLAYGTLKNALSHPDGLAVLAVLFEVSDINNRAIRGLEGALSQIMEGGDSAEVEDPPRLLELMPWNTNDFYRYNGSLTTPDCNEVVTWTIFQQTVKATEDELKLFRSLKNGKKRIGHNYRSTNQRYGRLVYLRRPEDEEDEEYALGMSHGRDGASAGPAVSRITSLLIAVGVLFSLLPAGLIKSTLL